MPLLALTDQTLRPPFVEDGRRPALSAAATDSCALCSPRATRANMLGMTKVLKISPSAVLAGPGCPMLTLHFVASLSSASLSAGLDPNGSLDSQLDRLGVRSENAQKS